MTKKNLAPLTIASVVCLLPLCLSFAVYNDLPDKTVMQWNLEGNPNWYAHKAVSAFGLPIFFMVFNIALYFLFCSDSKRKNISKAMQAFTLNNAENWNKTHRMAGILFIIGGMLFIIAAFLPLKNIVGILIILTILIITIIVPTLYSYSIHVKDKNKNK